jgi:hypothetical protein
MGSLNDMLKTLEQVDEGYIVLDNEEMKEIFGDIKGKVDGIYTLVSKLESESARLKKEKEAMEAAHKNMENRIKSIKNYVEYCLTVNETPLLVGDSYQLKLNIRNSVKKKDVELTSNAATILKLRYPSHVPVREKYELNAGDMKKVFNKEDMEKYFETGESRSVKFSVRKIK